MGKKVPARVLLHRTLTQAPPEEIRKEVEAWTPEETERVTGVPAEVEGAHSDSMRVGRLGSLGRC